MKKKCERGILGVIATCSECEFKTEDYITGEKKARLHHYKTGHEINIEVTYNCILYRYADIVKHGKAKFIDFTSGTRKPGITKESSDYAFSRVYSIVPDPDINIYEKSGKIKSNPLGICPTWCYNWIGEDNK